MAKDEHICQHEQDFGKILQYMNDEQRRSEEMLTWLRGIDSHVRNGLSDTVKEIHGQVKVLWIVVLVFGVGGAVQLAWRLLGNWMMKGGAP